jgi:tRNA(Ile)-lysidine synthase
MRRPPAVARVLERLTATAREHEMFLPGHTVLVAVSGGADSVCLVESLVRLRRLFKIRLEVFHLDHGLRDGSREDAAYVRRTAERLKLPFHLRVAEGRPAKGESVEAWARERRLVAMGAVAREIGAARVAVGHTADDQAETVLMALITGSGLRGLSGIAPASGPWVNPLIDVGREDVLAFVRALNLRPRSDPTNLDPRFLRNAIRLRGLPALERSVGRAIREPLVRTAAGLREDAEELQFRADEVIPDVFEETPEGADLHAVSLLDQPRAIAGRVVAHAVYAIGATCDRADVLAVLDLAAGRPGRRRDLSSGSTARRGPEYVHLSRPSPGAGESQLPRPGKGKTT